MKKLLIGISVILLLCIILWPESVLKIKSVESGNTVVLSNGAYVRLLGVSATDDAKEWLNELCGKEVKLVSDKNMFSIRHFDDIDYEDLYIKTSIGAYVVLVKEKQCVNAELLKSGKSLLVENLYDSLKVFRRYAKAGKERRGDEIPKVTPIPEYEKDEIELDPYVPSGERRHSAWYHDGNKNLEMLEEACDFNLPYTKKFANEIAARSEGEFNPGQICEIFAYCNGKWSYVNDPADSEYVARASETISCRLVGDCDDFAVLMASCMLAIGGRPCINTGYNSSGGHAFTEVDIAQFDEDDVLRKVREYFPTYDIKKLNYRRDGEHKWLNLDWQTPYPGGEYYDCTRRDTYPYIDGHWTWHQIL